jgi:hypothetical protein
MDNQRLNFLLEKLENNTANLAEQQEINEFYQSLISNQTILIP